MPAWCERAANAEGRSVTLQVRALVRASERPPLSHRSAAWTPMPPLRRRRIRCRSARCSGRIRLLAQRSDTAAGALLFIGDPGADFADPVHLPALVAAPRPVLSDPKEAEPVRQLVSAVSGSSATAKASCSRAPERATTPFARGLVAPLHRRPPLHRLPVGCPGTARSRRWFRQPTEPNACAEARGDESERPGGG